METATTSEARASACSDPKALQTDYRKLFRDYQALQATLSNTRAINGGYTIEQVTSALASIKQSANGIGKFVTSQLHPMYFNEIRADGSTPGQRVFDTQELFELILLQADLPSILAMSQVSKNFRSRIDGSSRQVQIKLYLAPDTGLQSQPILYRTPFGINDTPSRSFVVSCGPQDPEALYSQPEGIGATLRFKEDGTPPSVGAKWASMLICQPPIHTMFIHLLPHNVFDFPIKIFAADGFTVKRGFLCAQLSVCLAQNGVCASYSAKFGDEYLSTYNRYSINNCKPWGIHFRTTTDASFGVIAYIASKHPAFKFEEVDAGEYQVVAEDGGVLATAAGEEVRLKV